MSAAAIGAGRDPFAGVAPALNSLRTHLNGAARSVRSAAQGAGRIATAADRIRGGATSAGTAVKQIRTRADASGRSLTKAGRTAGRTASQLRTGGGKARSTLAPLNSVAAEGAAFSGVVGTLAQGSGTVSTLMGLFGGALTVASGAMTAVNVAMRANPLGFVLGLVAPLAGYLIEYAVNSETGQKIIKQVFDQVLKVFQTVLKFLGPVLKAYATVISAYFKAATKVVTTVLTVVGAALSKGFNGARSAVGSATSALSGIIRRAWNGFRTVIQPVLDWITKKIPDMFTRVKDATSKTLNGIGGFISTGMQGVMAAVTGPVKALISFANWVIDGLNKLSFSFFGKKFGVDLPKIPQLAEGGVVRPAGVEGPATVLPLSALSRLRPAEAARGTRRPTGSPDRARLRSYHATEGNGPLAVAADLLFLYTAAA
ncbi:tape-measure protein [Streptomyces lancefieldiae]|uniref:Tape-measure protein n=1 Tax=Streptomyces lancefieldiae TaxID=3075520 RepID=A0ABU3AIU4_9ACTN|nr:tape-measure protein [Streptomyces sp. DSM 40712]MDT0610105.1 tape-measure protein [Streptomyces sp. DSM 40712]